MKIRSAVFVGSATQKKDYPSPRGPEVAFVGRSNVGKSSLLNSLLNRKRLVKTSSTPGRTQTLNFFAINESFFFVDLPGYGYAKVPRAVRQQFGPMVEKYLEDNRYLACVVHILDIRRRPTPEDAQMRAYLRYHEIPVLTVATKSDKLSRNKCLGQLREIRKVLDIPGEEALPLFSAVTSQGKKEVWSRLLDAIEVLESRRG
ncbi:MAG: ribosome biogenesis GTP-binding protein YihA/YsxC [bacterium]|nr:ribosome biogenesis GTP-binding protein YihA/YsxC [bacterium]